MFLFNTFINFISAEFNRFLIFLNEVYIFKYVFVLFIVIIILLIVVILLIIDWLYEFRCHEKLHKLSKRPLLVVFISDLIFIRYVHIMSFNEVRFSELIPFIVFVFLRFVWHRITNCKLVVDLCFIPLALLAYKCSNSEFHGNVNNIITGCVGWVTFWAFWAQLEANKIASKDSQKTSIENTFFQMLAIHRENLNDITIEIKSKSYNGKKAVSKLCHEFLQKKSTHFEDCYKTFYDSNQCKSSMATYYYHLYRIVKYIDGQSVLEDYEKEDYMKNLRAQMSREEQTALFHNWLAGYLLYAPKNNNEEYGYKWETDTQPYLSRYNLIVHLEPEMLLQSARTFVSDNTWNEKVNDLNFEKSRNAFSDYGISKDDQIKKVMKILFKHYQ